MTRKLTREDYERIKKELGMRIKKARKHLAARMHENVSQARLGELCGWENAQSRIANYENGARNPSTGDILKIAQVTGTDAQWLLFGKGEMHEAPRVGGVAEESPVYGWESPGDLDPEHYAFVPRYDVHVSAGNGSVVYEAQEKERPQSFRLEYLQQKGLKEENLMCLTAAGDSMEPTITDGANLLVNRGETTVQDGKVYVIRFGSDIRVKRIYLRPDGGMTVHSDNPAFPDVDVTPDQMEHVAIIGRVVWQAGDL